MEKLTDEDYNSLVESRGHSMQWFKDKLVGGTVVFVSLHYDPNNECTEEMKKRITINEANGLHQFFKHLMAVRQARVPS